jgi:hypothetical protein
MDDSNPRDGFGHGLDGFSLIPLRDNSNIILDESQSYPTQFLFDLELLRLSDMPFFVILLRVASCFRGSPA